MISPDDQSLFPVPVDEDEQNIVSMGEDDDGTSYYEIRGREEETFEICEKDFYANMVDDIDDDELGSLCTELLEGIDDDISSRSEWEESINKALKYLGIKVEEFREIPFMYASSAMDNTMLSALLKSYAVTRSEFFPPQGPCESQILGETTAALEEAATQKADFYNHYLTSYDKEYYPDSEELIFYRNFFGCAFRKVYVDPVLKRPVARFIKPQDLIVNNNTSNLLSSNRITHVKYLDKKEIMLREQRGIFKGANTLKSFANNDYEEEKIDKTIKKLEGISTSGYENKSTYKFYIVHADMVINNEQGLDEDEELPRPYIFTICVDTKKIVSVTRNWKEDDEAFTRRSHFISYPYLKGFGLYGLGLAHLIGNNAITLTSILRQTLDKGMLFNFPGGLRVKGTKNESNDKAIGPSEFREIDTGGLPIQQAVSQMPYSEPSGVLIELRNQLKNDTAMVSGVAELPVPEHGGTQPVGTTLAYMENNSHVQSATMRTFRDSLSYELSLLDELFIENMEEGQTVPFSVPGKVLQISKYVLNPLIQIIPKADPSLSTSTQRILKMESILHIAQSAPELHDMREVYYKMYAAMNVTDIDKILPVPDEQEPQPKDPVTENMEIMQGMPAQAFLEQDHAAHILVHTAIPVEQESQQKAIAQAHIQQHLAMKYLIEMQLKMGMQMPQNEEMLSDPDVQNQIALAASQVAQQELMQQQQMAQMQQAQMEQELQNAQQQQVTEQQIMMEEIQKNAQQNILKSEDNKRKAEAETYKATLQYETEQNKLETEREIAEKKMETELVKEEMKQDKDLKAATAAYTAAMQHETAMEKMAHDKEIITTKEKAAIVKDIVNSNKNEGV